VSKKNKNYNRSDLEKSLLKKFPNLTNAQISKSIDIFFNTIVEEIALDNKVELRGFGTFSKKRIRPRKFINPRTKEVSYLGETATIHFKASKKLTEN
jgi:integration host factor subunit beta